uniref:39S ribosomal protein L1, mitochondrial n=1 Tax=Meloidogyne floridensis TaxID=298350 RepID=A0A915PA27_9BILA
MFLGQFTTSLPILYKTSTKCLPSLLSPLNLNLEFIRGRKRGRRKPSKAERLARLQRKEKKDAEKLEESQKRRLEELKKTKFAAMWPPRYDAEVEKDLPEVSQFNIFFKNEVKTIFHTISEALEFHRNLQLPSIYGKVDAPIKLRMELNMTTEKATKLIGASRQLVAIPFPFKHQEKRAIIAFAPNKELQDEALMAGAELALGPDSIKKVFYV